MAGSRLAAAARTLGKVQSLLSLSSLKQKRVLETDGAIQGKDCGRGRNIDATGEGAGGGCTSGGRLLPGGGVGPFLQEKPQGETLGCHLRPGCV